MTSANPHGEPLVHTDAAARERLGDIADRIVGHDRPIRVRCDDSVPRLCDGAPMFIRRARGYVPVLIDLGSDGPCVLGVGAHLKNTVCVTRGREAFVSQHVGDLDTPEARRFLHETVVQLTRILAVRPEQVACDRHPDYASSELARASGLPLTRVQHHHAHVAAVLAEHGVHGAALGVALDGPRPRRRRRCWGAASCCASMAPSASVSAILCPLPLPGGYCCARETWRCAAAALHLAGRGATRSHADPLCRGNDGRAGAANAGAEFAPLTSSAGRRRCRLRTPWPALAFQP